MFLEKKLKKNFHVGTKMHFKYWFTMVSFTIVCRTLFNKGWLSFCHTILFILVKIEPVSIFNKGKCTQFRLSRDDVKRSNPSLHLFQSDHWIIFAKIHTYLSTQSERRRNIQKVLPVAFDNVALQQYKIKYLLDFSNFTCFCDRRC